MEAAASSVTRIRAAVDALGAGPLDEAGLQRHVAPLFERMRAQAGARIYLANHSLGRPPDAIEDDVREGLAAWYAQLGGAWDAWLAECDAYRARLATLLGARRADAVVPKTSAGQGLRAVLNTYDDVPRVVATRGEFDSLDVILREYARRGRIRLELVEAREGGHFASDDILRALHAGCDLLVVSEVVFNTGQRLTDLDALVRAAHASGARVLVDVYHAVGAFPVDVTASDADFAVGGAYKYLRGGPGAAFLYVHPRHLDAGLRTLDIGWFAKRDRFRYLRPEPPLLEPGGDAFLESTPPVLTYYQARAGQVLLLALGVARVRAHSLELQRHLVARLRATGLEVRGGTDDHGAFVTVRHRDAETLAAGLRVQDVIVDARGPWLRLCPDVLTTRVELDTAATRLAALASSRP
jgi:kynureninase